MLQDLIHLIAPACGFRRVRCRSKGCPYWWYARRKDKATRCGSHRRIRWSGSGVRNRPPAGRWIEKGKRAGSSAVARSTLP